MIARASDATAFLSTAALIVGIFLTVAAAAFASSLPEKLEELMRPVSKANRDERYRKLIRAGLFALLVANTVGTLFPFTLLITNTMTSVQSAWIWVAYSYTVSIIVINLGAVSTIYLGPILARRRLHTPNSSTREREDKSLTASNPTPRTPTNNACSNLSIRRARWHSPVTIAAGVVLGLLIGIRFKRSAHKEP